MAHYIKVFKNRALIAITLGALAGGDLLARSSLGRLQKPQIIELPVSIQPAGAIPGPSEFIYTVRHEHTSEIMLVLTSETYAKFKSAEPLNFESTSQLPGRYTFRSDGKLTLITDSDFAGDLVGDEDEVIELLLFAVALIEDDGVS